MDGKMIAEKRKEKGLTQDALGAMLGISGKAVSKWERGLSQPDVVHMGKLAQLLDLAVERTAESPEAPPTFRSTVRREWFRILSVGTMIAVCVCHLIGMLPAESTVVSLGLSTVAFCFDTIIQS